jgi:thiamine kinase
MLPLPAPYHQADAQLLAQGLTNRAYCLQLQQQRYFYRQGIADPASLFINRTQERQALLIAEGAGLLPDIIYHSTDGQQLILAWCDEPSWSPDYFSSPVGIRQLGQLAASVHAIPVQLTVLDLALYLQQLCDGVPELPDPVYRLVQRLQAMLRTLPTISPVFCHNDINPTNLLGVKPWLVDWEYAALGDPAFELAGICRAGQFDWSQQQLLVQHYQAAGGCCDVERVTNLLAVVDMVSLLWCEKMRQLRAEPRYDQWREQLYQSLGLAHSLP